MNRHNRVRAPQHLAGYLAVPPFAWSGWRLRIPGGPIGGQYHGFIAADGKGWPNGQDEISSPPTADSAAGLGDVEVTSEPWDPVWGGTVLREGQDNSDFVFRSSAEMRPRPNASGGANVVHGYQRRRSAGFAEAPGNYRALGLIPGTVLPRMNAINPNIVNNPNAPRPVIHELSEENPRVMTTASGQQVINVNGQDVPVGSTTSGVAVPMAPHVNIVRSILAPAYGATSVVAQPPLPTGPAQNLVAYQTPPTSPQPSPTVAAGPSNFVPSTGQPLPVTPGAAWQPNVQYPLGSVVTDPNGNFQTAVSVGTSGAAAPSWGTVLGTTTSDGSVVWQMTAAGAGASASLTSWFSQSTVIAGVENLWIALGAGALLFFMMKGKR